MQAVTEIPEERLTDLLRTVAELNEASDLLQDPVVDQTLGHIIKLVNDPDIPSHVAAPLVVQLTAASVQYKLKAKVYQLRSKGDIDATKRKNLYYTLAEGAADLAAALKYIVRN